jgi:hypothetical protein
MGPQRRDHLNDDSNDQRTRKERGFMATNDAYPIIIHRGKKSRKKLKRLRRGNGQLAEKIAHDVSVYQAGVTDKEVFAVVVTIKRKRKRRRKGGGSGPFG